MKLIINLIRTMDKIVTAWNKFKIGDKVYSEKERKYMLITDIQWLGINHYNWYEYVDNDLRSATPEEIDKYFK